MTSTPLRSAGYDINVAPAAALMADQARATMLAALLDGRPLAAGELARVAGVSPATASAHLARLLGGGLVTVVSQGRHRYYRLAGEEVAAAMEALAHLGPGVQVRNLRASRQASALAIARTCYDHLAGRAGVALLDTLLDQGVLAVVSGGPGEIPWSAARPAGGGPDGGPEGARGRGIPDEGRARPLPLSPARPVFEATSAGSLRLAAFGINVEMLARGRRRFAGACLDWTERRWHLNGSLAAALTARLLDLGWLEHAGHRRAVRVTAAGRDGLATTFGWSDPADPAEDGRL